MMRLYVFTFLMMASLSAPLFVSGTAVADESTANKMKDTGDDVSTGAKKAVRNGNQDVRKATGNDSVWKDAKDSVNNKSDDVAKNARKAKRKIKPQ